MPAAIASLERASERSVDPAFLLRAERISIAMRKVAVEMEMSITERS